MTDQNADRYKTMCLLEIDAAAQTGVSETLEYESDITTTMLQLVDYPLPGPDESVGADPYNSEPRETTAKPYRA